MLHRVVHVYCFLLPFGLMGSIGWFTPIAVCILVYTFFGLDALADQIADPFDTQPNDLPLDAICRSIEIACLELIDEPTPEPLARSYRQSVSPFAWRAIERYRSGCA